MRDKNNPQAGKEGFLQTGIEGFDKLMEEGIPIGSSTLVCGSPGSGKTIFCLQAMANLAKAGRKCFYMSFEEREDKLKAHMNDFSWDPESLEKGGLLKIQRYDPYGITPSVEALLAKAKGELLIEANPVIFPDGIRPDIVVVDSLSSIAAAFHKKEETYRIYAEQLFKFFESQNVTSFLISELSEAELEKGSVEQFLADNVILLYNLKKQNMRENAIEILKMRGAKFQKKTVAMKIVSGAGIEVYPEQTVY